MNLIRRKLNAVRRSAQKGFTLIELAIVGLFLGLLAIFAISQFSGSATDTTKANGLFEASTKIADNWSLIAQSCGISNDITNTRIAKDTVGDVAADNLDVLLGVAVTADAYVTCVNSSGVRPLTGVATGAANAATIQGYAVTAGNDTTLFAGRNTLKLVFGGTAKYVPDALVLALVTKYSDPTATSLTATGNTTDRAIQYGATAARTLTIVKSL